MHETEKFINMHQAATLVPGGTSANCIWRWCRKGVIARNGQRVLRENILKNGQTGKGHGEPMQGTNSEKGWVLQVRPESPEEYGQRVLADTRPAVDPFAPLSSRVARTLLGNPSKAWALSNLAKEAKVSVGLTWKVKKALLEEGFIQVSNKRIILRDAAGLLNSWKKKYDIPAKKVSRYAVGKTDEMESKLLECCASSQIRCALTGLSGAWRAAPMVRYSAASAYVDVGVNHAAMDDLARCMEAKPVDTGANLILYPTRDESVFFGMRSLAGMNVVSPIQLYLDLLQVAGRGEDAASEIMAKEIKPLFEKSKPS